MPFISAIVGAIGSAFAAVGSFFGALTATALGSALVKIGLNVAMHFISKALFPEKKPPSGVNLELEYGERVSRKVMSGLCAVVGHEVYGNTYGSSNKFLQYCYVLSDFPCVSLERVWVNGEAATLADADADGYRNVTSGEYAGKIKMKFVDGWQTEADAVLVAAARPEERWTEDHILDGMAQVHVRQTFDREKLTRPAQFLFELKGAVYYDWRKDSTVGGSGLHRFDDMTTWEFSENPIVIAYNYHRGLVWRGDKFCGMDVPASDLPLGRWTTAANICDETVEGEPRYVVSLGIDCGPETDHGDNVEALMRACAGQIIEQVDGIWPLVGTEQPVVATLYENVDFVTGAPVTFQRLRPMNQLVNSVAGVFPDPANQWSPSSYETATDAGLVTIDRRSRDVNIDFDMVRRGLQAAQLASIFFKENRLEATMACTVRPRWQVLEVGDWITIVTKRYGTRTWQIAETDLTSMDAEGPRNVALSLQERSGAIFDPVTDLPPPFIPLPPGVDAPVNEVVDFAVIASSTSGADGRIVPAIRVSFVMPDDPTIEAVLIEYRVAGVEGQTVSEIFSEEMRNGATVRLLTNAVVSNTVYEVRHKLLTDPARETVASAWLQVTTPDTPFNDVRVGLGQVEQDVYGALERTRRDIDGLNELVSLLAGNANINNADEYLNRSNVTKSLGANTAAITKESQARVTATDALASDITAVNVKANNATAGGFFKVEAQAGGTGISSQISMFAYAEFEEEYKEGGLFIQLYDDGGELKARVAIAADQFVVFDPDTGDEGLPLVFEDGQLKLEVARIGEAIVENLVTADGKVRLGELAPGVSGLEITT